jgi:glycosyltransferase involved in cell wall biosynthesis
MPSYRWSILTGEYPPQAGGVSDYTHLVACGLAQAGDEVHVWAPVNGHPFVVDPGVTVHGLPNNFGPRALRQLGSELDQLEQPRRLLVQYVPHAFGYKAMNLPFCLWLWARRREPVWAMFHEVAVPFRWRQSWKHRCLAAMNHAMAALLLAAAERVFLSVPAWKPILNSLGRFSRPPVWLPVPSNLPTSVQPKDVAEIRERLGVNATTVILGHFGTYGKYTTQALEAVFPDLLKRDLSRVMLLLGRGGESYRVELSKRRPELADRLFAPGQLDPQAAATHLAACDLLLQPYPDDGATSRRGSLMAGLALGRPIVTTEGPLTEPLWRESQAVVLVARAAPRQMVQAAERVLADEFLRTDLGMRAAALYRSCFSLDRVITMLRAA